MYTALITHQYVVQMGWKKFHLHESSVRKEEQQTTYKRAKGGLKEMGF